jgi:hypothetical protein
MMRRLVAVGLLVGSVVGPARAGTDVHIGINIGTPPPPPPPPPPVVIEAPPQLVMVPRTTVYYAPHVPHDVFSYGGHYYMFRTDAWYWAADFRGPWYHIGIERVPPRVLAVPVVYYKAPPRHWHKHGRPPWAHHGKRHGKHHHHHHHDD